MHGVQKLAYLTRRGALAGLGAAGLAGCGGSSKATKAEIKAERPTLPTVLLVTDFAAAPGEVDARQVAGTTAGRLAQGTPRTQRELEIGHAFTRDVKAAMVAQLGALGLPAEPAVSGMSGTGHPVIIVGAFVSVAAGPSGEPEIVGFRAGYPDVLVDVQVFDRIASGGSLLEGLETSITRGPQPVPTSLLPGLILDEAGGVQGLSPAQSSRLSHGAEAAAKVIVGQLRPIFVSQGWLV